MGMEMDPLALEVTQELDVEEHTDQSKATVTWEHQDLAQVKIKVLRGHTAAVKSCQYCDRGRKILTASHDKTVVLWDFETGNNLQIYHGGHDMYISKARANPDATRFASCGWDKKINVWDMETATVLWTGLHGGIITSCNFSHDGQLLVSGCDLDNVIKVWDVRSGDVVQEINDLHTSTVTSCQFSPAGDRLVTTSMDKSTKFYDLKSQCNTITLNGHTNIISDASFSIDERKLATVSYDKSIQIWDVSTGMYRSQGSAAIEKAHEGCISSCDFSEDGQLLVTGGYDNTVSMWDVENRVQKLKLQGHDDWVEEVSFSPDQKWLLTCSKDKTVRLWNIEETDHIPMVMEKRKAVGAQVYKCTKCGKPFSVSQMDNPNDIKSCVFCRLQAHQ